MAPANEKQQAHQLLDQLDAGQLAAVVHLLQVMTEPLSRSLASAPVEEEEISSDTAAALDRARASLARGEAIPHEDILREFGLDSGMTIGAVLSATPDIVDQRRHSFPDFIGKLRPKIKRFFGKIFGIAPPVIQCVFC
jgi:hypothetical protein